MKRVKKAKQQVCSICQVPYEGWGNNAQPINPGRCCNQCNWLHVVPARMGREAGHLGSWEAFQQMLRDSEARA